MDSSTCSAVGKVPDALLETVEAAMETRGPQLTQSESAIGIPTVNRL